ncbi:hypothetical protein B0T16DRAFT_383985 [Cercophora newfieldiana]|uniref:Uncharacterized protein n=1 Tax=Cercophora newfieldiana TaxID=92897 RepID=A0AA39YM45_9PEZI|nr:hypothetical protein B0T16DRAFT_383985 [Cercophora newfieldiana]
MTCNGCRRFSSEDPTNISFPGHFLYGHGLPRPTIQRNKPQLEGNLEDFFETPSSRLLLRILRDIIRYHHPCINTILTTRFLIAPHPPSYETFKGIVDDLIPLVSNPDAPPRDITLPSTTPESEFTTPIDPVARLDANVKIVVLSWLFHQYFGPAACPYLNVPRFYHFPNMILALEAMKDLARLVDALLGIIRHMATRPLLHDEDEAGIVNLSDEDCMSMEVPRLKMRVEMAGFYRGVAFDERGEI